MVSGTSVFLMSVLNRVVRRACLAIAPRKRCAFASLPLFAVTTCSISASMLQAQVVYQAVAQGAFPGAAVAFGGPRWKRMFIKGYGTPTFESKIPITGNSIFDMASVTKVRRLSFSLALGRVFFFSSLLLYSCLVSCFFFCLLFFASWDAWTLQIMATVPAIMLLIDHEALSLDDRVAAILPEFQGPSKGKIRVKHVLQHVAGLRETLPVSEIPQDYDRDQVSRFTCAVFSALLFPPKW